MDLPDVIPQNEIRRILSCKLFIPTAISFFVIPVKKSVQHKGCDIRL